MGTQTRTHTQAQRIESLETRMSGIEEALTRLVSLLEKPKAGKAGSSLPTPEARKAQDAERGPVWVTRTVKGHVRLWSAHGIDWTGHASALKAAGARCVGRLRAHESDDLTWVNIRVPGTHADMSDGEVESVLKAAMRIAAK